MATALKKLRDLATDAVVLPTREDLYRRKCAHIDAAKAELARTVARVIEAEKMQPSQRRGYAELMASKSAQEEKVERLCREAGMVKQQLVDARPKPPLTPSQQIWADLIPAPTQCPYSAADMAEANADLERITADMRMARFNGATAQEVSLMPAYREARIKVAVMAGGHAGQWPPSMPHEDRVAGLKKWGKK